MVITEHTKITDETGKAIGSITPYGLNFSAALYGTVTIYKQFYCANAAERWIRKGAK